MASGADAQKLVANLQTDLHQLSNEARKKYTPVKDAAESCLVKVRNIASGTNSDEHLILRLRQGSNEILHPFLMGCATRNNRIVQISLGAIQRIVSCKALESTVCATIVNELWGLMESECEELRLLQTLTLLVTTGNDVARGPTLAKCLVICFRLHFAKDSVVINTASASVRQLVGQVFERVLTEDASHKHIPEPHSPTVKPQGKTPPSTLRPCATDAYMLFQDLCQLVNAEHPVWLIGITEMTRTLGLELLEAVLTNFSTIFNNHAEFRFLLKEQVCPLVIKLFSPNLKFVQVTSQHPHSSQDPTGAYQPNSDRPYFPIVMRLLRVVAVLITLYYSILVTECEIFLSLLVKFLEGDKLPWQRGLALEVLQKVTSNPFLLKNICANYDQKPHATKVLQEIVNNLGGFAKSAFNQQENVLQSSSATSMEPDSAASQIGTQPGFVHRGVWIPLSLATQGAPKAMFLEMLDKHDAPLLPDGYCLSLAYNSLIEATNSVQQAIESEPADESLSRQILESTHGGILCALSLLIEASCDENITGSLLKCICTLLDLSCRLSMWGVRDACLGSLCKAALPPNYMFRVLNIPQEQKTRQEEVGSGAEGVGLPSNVVAVGSPCPTPWLPQSAYGSQVMLAAKNLQAMRSLISAAQNVSASLHESWYLVLITLEHLVWILSLKPGEGGAFKMTQSQEANSGSVLTTAVMADIPVLASMLNKLIELTGSLDDVGLHHVISALCKMSNNSMAVAQHREPSYFPIAKLLHCGLMNLHRIEIFWSPMNSHFIDVCAHSHPKLREWGAKSVVSLIIPAFSSAKSDSLDTAKLHNLIFSSMVGLCAVLYDDVRSIQLNCLMQILQGNGQQVDVSLWPKIIDVIGRVAQDDANFSEATIKQGYQAVHLVTTDFLSNLSMECVKQLIEVVTKFGAQKQELNISLSAVGLLWTLSDFLFRNRSTISSNDLNGVWLCLYHCLSALCVNDRPPVRKSACQTLLQTVASHGSALGSGTWRRIIWEVLFPLMDSVVRQTETASTTKVKSEAKGNSSILIHHSRDTESKQWAETYVQTLSGVVRIFNAQLKSVHRLEDFPKAWNSLLGYINNAATSQSAEISLAALKSFQELLQGKSTSPDGKPEEKIQAVSSQELISIEMWLNAWQTWLGIGEALTELRRSEEQGYEASPRSPVIDRQPGPRMVRVPLPLPSPNHICTFLHTFPFLFEKTKAQLSPGDIPRWSKVLKGITSLPISSEAAPFILPTAADITPSQEAVLEAVKVLYQEVSKSSSHLRPTLPGLFVLLLSFVDFACKAPDPLFMDKSTSTNNNGGCADWVVQNYVPFAELCLKRTVQWFAETAHFTEIIEADILTLFVKTVHVPLSLKYNCPSQTTWKLAASSLFNVLSLGLPIARQNLSHFQSLWMELANLIEAFLFSKSTPSPNLSTEERKRHEFIDCQCIDMIRSEILPFTALLPKEFVRKIIDLLNRGSISLVDSRDVLGLNSMHKQRNELSRACFDALLAMSQGEPDLVKCSSQGSRSSHDGMGGEAVNSLLGRCRTVIAGFVDEEKSTGGLPLPKQKAAEMLCVLRAVTTLMDSLQKQARPNESEHKEIWRQLIDLYPDLIGCMGAENADVKVLLADTLLSYKCLLRPPN